MGHKISWMRATYRRDAVRFGLAVVQARTHVWSRGPCLRILIVASASRFTHCLFVRGQVRLLSLADFSRGSGVLGIESYSGSR